MDKNEGLLALSYAVRGRVVLKYTGQITLIQAILNLVPVGVALRYGDYFMAEKFSAAALLLAGMAVPWVRFPEPKRLLHSEVMAVSGLAFIIGAGAMVYPFSAAGLSLQDAWFESISGITTTGLTTVRNIRGQSEAILFARAWLQWCGGMGILVLTLALLAEPPAAFKHELSSVEQNEGMATGVRFQARRVVAVYLALTGLAIAALLLSGLDRFTATVLALSAVSTGGFAIDDSSLAGLPLLAGQFSVTLTSLLGAVSFPLIYRSYSQRNSEIFSNTETRGLLIATVVTGVLVATMLADHGGLGWLESLTQGLLLGVSSQSTSGFSALDVSRLPADIKTVLIGSMTIGGTMGSTAGGIKIIRLLILVQLVRFAIRASGTPSHAVVEPRVDGQRIEARTLVEVATFTALVAASVFISWLPFIALGYNPLDSLFEIVSALGTVGLSSGITQPDLPPLLKNILCLDMLAGRLEIIALLVLVHPRTWFGRRAESL